MSETEVCPCCGGTGRGAYITVTRNGVTTSTFEACPLCKGRAEVRAIESMTLADVVKLEEPEELP